MAGLRAALDQAIDDEDIAPYMVALEPLLETRDPMEIAAAAVALLRRRPTDSSAPAATASPTKPRASEPRTAAVPSWAKLFLSVGERDGLSKGDLLGAITGEASVPGDAVGRIEIRESHTLVEVHADVAQKVIRALNGTTIRGRSVRADFDRPRRQAPRKSGPRR